MNQQQKPKRFIPILRWVARLGSLCSVALLVLFLFGEEMSPGQLTTSEILGLLLGWGWANGLTSGPKLAGTSW